MRISLVLALCIVLGGAFCVDAGDTADRARYANIYAVPVEAFSTAWLHTSRSVLAQPARTVVTQPSIISPTKIFLNGSTNLKGDLAEAIVSGHLKSDLGGRWLEVTPRSGRQGLDQLFVKIDRRSGLPKDILVGETKYGTSQLGSTKDGNQMSNSWIKPRLEKLGGKYADVAHCETISTKKCPWFDFGVKDKLEIGIKVNRKIEKRIFWQDAKGNWHYDGKPEELARAKKQAENFGDFFNAAAKGTVRYRSRIFHVGKPVNGKVHVDVYDAANIPQNGWVDISKLTKTGKGFDIPVKDWNNNKALTRHLQNNLGIDKRQAQAMAKKLKEANKSKEVKENVQVVAKLSLKQIAVGTIMSALIAGGIDFGFQWVTSGSWDPRKVNFDLAKIGVTAGLGGASFLTGSLVSNALGGGTMAKYVGGAFCIVFFSVGENYFEYLRGNMTAQQATERAIIDSISGLVGCYVGTYVGTRVAAFVSLISCGRIDLGASAGGVVGIVVGTGVTMLTNWCITETYGRLKTWWNNPKSNDAIVVYINEMKTSEYWKVYWAKNKIQSPFILMSGGIR